MDQTSGNAFGASVEIADNDNRVIGCTSDSVHLRGNFNGPAASRNVVGGTGPGEGNTLFSVEILCWADDNVVIGNRRTHVRIEGSQYCVYPMNNRLGGPTPNDAGDADTGGNGLQNYPVITAAATGGSGTRVAGTLNSLASQTFALEFFASPACDPTGFGEGAQFLGGGTVTTDSAGHASFDLSLPTPITVGSAVTATARQVSTGNTSEFSACFQASGAACGADFNADGFVTGDDFDAFVAAFAQGC